ncbi:gtp-binding protein obg [Nannochloropsis oceanica]
MVNEERLGLRNVDPEFAFFDQAQMYVRAGSGGQGAATFKLQNGRQKGAADGGAGGRGGDVVFVCDGKINTLQAFRGRASFHAENGQDGDRRVKNGANGRSVEVKVPPGTMLYNRETRALLGELKHDEERLVVARGGEGGTGNASVKGGRGTSGKASPPQKGQRGWMDIELKLVADVGLVGCPNAGKSTLLAAVSNARPKIADYPFTTLVPNLGVCDGEALQYASSGGVRGKGIVISDIPGLLEGAHRGLGLGLAFLRHIERCRIILHVVNGASVDPIGDFVAINQELTLFNPVLASKPQVVVLNKIDLPQVREKTEELKTALLSHMGHTRLLEISAAAGTNTKELMLRVARLLEKVDAASLPPSTALSSSSLSGLEEGGGTVERLGDGEGGKEGWRALHPKVTALALTLKDVDYYRLEEQVKEGMEAVGLLEELKREGAKEGERVWVTPRGEEEKREAGAGEGVFITL